MIKVICDECGKELPKAKSYGIDILKSYRLYIFERNIATHEKQIFSQKELCWNCYINFIEQWDKTNAKKHNKS